MAEGLQSNDIKKLEQLLRDNKKKHDKEISDLKGLINALSIQQTEIVNPFQGLNQVGLQENNGNNAQTNGTGGLNGAIYELNSKDQQDLLGSCFPD